jgi:hypothetical protein
MFFFFFFFFFFLRALLVSYNVLLHARVCAHAYLSSCGFCVMVVYAMLVLLASECLAVCGQGGGGWMGACVYVIFLSFFPLQILAECFLLMGLVVRQVLRT